MEKFAIEYLPNDDITIGESIEESCELNEETLHETALGTIVGALTGGATAEKTGNFKFDDVLMGAVKGAFTGSALSNLVAGKGTKADYLKLAGVIALADLGDNGKLDGSLVTNALSGIKSKITNMISGKQEESLEEGALTTIAALGTGAKFVADHWDEILQGLEELGIALNNVDSNIVDIIGRHKALKANPVVEESCDLEEDAKDIDDYFNRRDDRIAKKMAAERKASTGKYINYLSGGSTPHLDVTDETPGMYDEPFSSGKTTKRYYDDDFYMDFDDDFYMNEELQDFNKEMKKYNINESLESLYGITD